MKKNCFLLALCWVYTYFFAVTADTLIFHNAVNFSEQCVVATFADILTRIYACAALAYEDRTARYRLPVCTFCTQAF